MWSQLSFLALFAIGQVLAAVDCPTQRCSNDRVGYSPNANMDPYWLTTNMFGRKAAITLPPMSNSFSTAGDVYASVLVYIDPKTSTSYAFIVTQYNNIYTVNLKTYQVTASRNLGVAPFAPNDEGFWCHDITNGYTGITGTPVIDNSTGIAYFWSKGYGDGFSSPAGADGANHYFWAVDVLTLTTQNNYPIILHSRPATNAVDNNVPYFQSFYQNQRSALLLMGGAVYAGFGSHCDVGNYTGWVVGVNVTSATIINVFSTVVGNSNFKHANGGGVWMSGAGLASDQNGRMFFVAGNSFPSSLSTASNDASKLINLGESVVALTVNRTTKKLAVSDFFLPSNYASLNQRDLDAGSAGITLLPTNFGTGTTTPQLLVTGGKDGALNILNRNTLGGYLQGPTANDLTVQTIKERKWIFCQAGVYPPEGGYLYMPYHFQSSKSMAAYRYYTSGGQVKFANLGSTTDSPMGWPTSPVVSSCNNIPGTGIVWVHDFQQHTLTAYAAVPTAAKALTRLWSDTFPSSSKNYMPTLTNNAVLFAYDGRLIVYGYKSNYLPPSVKYLKNIPVGKPTNITQIMTISDGSLQITGVAPADSTTMQITSPASLAVPFVLNVGGKFIFNITVTPKAAGVFSGYALIQGYWGPPFATVSTLSISSVYAIAQ